MCVDDGGDAVVVDVHGASGHALHADDALVLRLVGQHGPGHHVTDGEDAGDGGGEVGDGRKEPIGSMKAVDQEKGSFKRVGKKGLTVIERQGCHGKGGGMLRLVVYCIEGAVMDCER